MKTREIKNKRQTHLQNKGHLTLTDLFRYYPYKDVDMTKVQGRNYVPKDEIIPNHKHSLTIAQWKEIVTAIFDVILSKIIAGERITLPCNFGDVFIRKYRAKNPKYDYSFSEGYQVFLGWKKTLRTPLGWAMRLFWSAKAKKQILNVVKNDTSAVNHYYIE